MYNIITRISFSIFALLLVFSPQFSNAAVDLYKLQSQLHEMEFKLNELRFQYQPKVLGVSNIVVSNDQELFDALKSVTGGETISLNPGSYSHVSITGGQYNQLIIGGKKAGRVAPLPTSMVRITSADPNNRAVLRGIVISKSDNWQIDTLSFFPTDRKDAAKLDGNNIKFLKNNISFSDSPTHDVAVLQASVGAGIRSNGNNVEIGYNYIKHVNFAITSGGNNVNIHHNYITDIIGDGIRVLGDRGLIEHNVVTNLINGIAGNHYDAFQSWNLYNSTDGTPDMVRENIVRNNSFIYQNKPHPQRANMQGIGLFDGPFKDWKVENNLVVINAYHGISMYGGVDSVMNNNVVVDPIEGKPGAAWIRFFNLKNGSSTLNSSMSNNYANNALAATTSSKVSIANHTQIKFSEYGQYFVNPGAMDFTPKPGAFPFSVGATIDMSQVAPEPVYVPGVVIPIATTTAPVIAPSPTSSTTPTPAPVPVATTTQNMDSDNDTISNTVDNCTTVANTDQKNFDNDTRGDACDTDDDNDSILDTQEKAGCQFNASTSCGAVAPTPAPTPTSTLLTTFKIGDTITVTKNVNVRTAGLLSTTTLKGVNPLGSIGTLIGGPVVTNDRYGQIVWFNVNFTTGFDGWVGADNYQLLVTPTSTISDSDSDGVSNTQDNCSTVANTDQKNFDNDTRGDACDTDDDNDSILDTQEKAGCQFNASTSCGAIAATMRVSITENVNVRSTVGGAILGVQYKGAQGTQSIQVAATSGAQDAVYINFDTGVDGYVAKSYVTTGVVSGPTDIQAQINMLVSQLAELQRMLAELMKTEG